MANLSQEKRQRMLSFLNQLKAQNRNDDETLMAINEIENALNEKKYGLVWERHEEAVDVKMRTHIPVFTEVRIRKSRQRRENRTTSFSKGIICIV